jgi:alpha-galactosidase
MARRAGSLAAWPTALLVLLSVACRPEARPVSLARTPPMGWNSWNHFACDVSEQLIQETADAMAANGMRDAGYQYVVIDDCWQVARDSAGTIVADPQRFPSGIKALADYVHSKGLKFGIYTDAGLKTCQGRPGSYGHEAQDAKTYATWGVDYTKVDWCYADSLDAVRRYTVVRDAFRAAGRDIVLSICEWGQNHPWAWAPGVGNLWRTTGDIEDKWTSMLDNLDVNSQYPYAAGPGHWNDPDMLEVGNGGMTWNEYRAHLSLWAIMAAPLMAGNDLRSLNDSTRAILLNREVIAVDQDSLGTQGTLIAQRDAQLQVWMKPLADGSRAVALLNRSTQAAEIGTSLKRLGISATSATVRDLWAHADLGPVTDRVTATVPPHGVVMLRVGPR